MVSDNYKKILIVAIVITLAIFMIRATHLEREITVPEIAFKYIFTPFQMAVVAIENAGKSGISFLISLKDLAEENKKLKEEVRQLKSELAKMEEYKIQNKRLKELLQYKEFTIDNYDLISAGVIGRNPSNWFSTITINRGMQDGIKPNMTVLVPEGLVGKVVIVHSNTAEVLLITDPRMGVGAVVQQTRLPGVVRGVTGSCERLKMLHLPKDTQIKRNQVVVTSGLGGVYPKGIRIGRILKAYNDPSGLFQIAEVEPFVDFKRLEYVFVVTEVYNPEINLLEGME